ncbi:PIR protein CIR protein [Plasmodium vinckei vinckei]|uniref:PIR protein CIR protein n=1 Tax=Plasmodium vinckei vinckei TaxID=54757 RepID=A0A449BS20_PLAVN|nr:PIR protein CIR protein [Plasmodium vinckei vinckei]VEV56208.1 PIR protein CIR protein [Plasmodium vinckei vinckei]
MAQRSYNIKDVYKEIFTINDYFEEETNGTLIVKNNYKSIHDYCGSWRDSRKDNCHNYIQLAICGFIYLLKTLKDMPGLEYDKLAEYAILWLIYKLDAAPNKCGIELNEFYTKYIEKNSYYNNIINGYDNMTYKDIINKKKELMNMNISEISKFNTLFYILFFSYYLSHVEYPYCVQFPLYPISFSNKFNELNEDSKNIEGSLYTQILSTLSNDYNNLINKFGNDESCDFPTISPVKTSLSSSIASKLIPGLSTFAIPAFLGISYKTIYKKTIKKSKEENETKYMIRRLTIIPGTIIMIDIC